MTDRVLLLSPSRGLGDGIERYVEKLESAFTSKGLSYQRLNLDGSGIRSQIQLLAKVRATLDADREPARLVAAHLGLMPVARLAARHSAIRGVSIICHGIEVWGPRWQPRRELERRSAPSDLSLAREAVGVRRDLPGVLARAADPPAGGGAIARGRAPHYGDDHPASRIPRLHRARGVGAASTDRLGWGAGGDHRAQRPAPDAAQQHQATDHAERGYQSTCGRGPERIIKAAPPGIGRSASGVTKPGSVGGRAAPADG